METFHLYHLARAWSGTGSEPPATDSPLTAGPVKPDVVSQPKATTQPARPLAGKDSVIRAAAVHLVFASRTSQDFITPEEVTELERWTGLVRTYPSIRTCHFDFDVIAHDAHNLGLC